MNQVFSIRLAATTVLEVDNASLKRYGVDVCSGELGVILIFEEPRVSPDDPTYDEFVRRALRAMNCFRRVTFVQLYSKENTDHLENVIAALNVEGACTTCEIQVNTGTFFSLAEGGNLQHVMLPLRYVMGVDFLLVM